MISEEVAGAARKAALAKVEAFHPEKAQSDDPEVPFEVEVVVKITGSGKRKHREQMAYEMARHAHFAFGSRATAYLHGEVINFDPIKHDGNEPELCGSPDKPT